VSAAAQRTPWLFGPWPDLLLGCGVLYALLFGLFLVFGEPIRTAQPSLIFPVLILALGVPHYGATLLRVYEQRRERQAFAFFSVWATLAILAFFVATLHRPGLASFWLTLYLTWSPWHYTGQNYGLAVMFLRRGGVDLDATTKRWIYLSFLLSYVLVFLEMHAGTSRASASDLPAAYLSELGPHFTSLGIPVAWAGRLASVVGTAYVSALVVSALRLRGRASWRVALPAAVLALSQLLWFSAPYVLHMAGLAPGLDPLNWEFRSHYFTWIALAHSIQYLWVTAYYARQSSAWHGQGVQYAKALAAGAAPWALPFLVFGPQALGPLSADAGLAMLVAATVNIHHFVLDGAIWKLRGRIADVLIRNVPDSTAREAPRRFGPRWAVWALCAFALLLQASKLVNEERYRRDFAQGEIADARAANEQLTRIGLDRGSVRLALGRRLLEAKRPAEAREQLLRSLELVPQAETYFALGRSYEHERLWVRAGEAYETALAQGLPPEQEPEALAAAAGVWLEAGETERARTLFARIASGRERYYHLSEALREETAAAPEPLY
jgi:hypothetical protein